MTTEGRFEWDAVKAARNLAKHRVSFELACRVWDDPLHLVVPDRIVDGEERWHAVGLVGRNVLLVVHICHDDAAARIRLIGARKATARERRTYEEQAI